MFGLEMFQTSSNPWPGNLAESATSSGSRDGGKCQKLQRSFVAVPLWSKWTHWRTQEKMFSKKPRKHEQTCICSALSHGPLLFALQAALPVFFGGWGAKDALTKQQSAPRRDGPWKDVESTARWQMWKAHIAGFFVLKVKRWLNDGNDSHQDPSSHHTYRTSKYIQ